MSKPAGAAMDSTIDGVVDESALSSAISNNEDVTPFIRSAFASNKPEALIHQLKSIVRNKDQEIVDLCKLHYSEFISAVDAVRYVLTDAHSLRSSLAESNQQLQSVGDAFLRMLDSLIQCHGTKQNIVIALESLTKCTAVVDLCMRVNDHVMKDSYYPALKALDILERDLLPTLPARALRQLLYRQIPVCKAHIERKVNTEFSDWLVHIRTTSSGIGQLAIAQSSSARQREQFLRARQREAAEQSRSASNTEIVYILDLEDTSEDTFSEMKFDLTPVYRAYHINTCLGMHEQFREHYFRNRQLQLMSDLEFSGTQSFLESHQGYFAQLTGFFVVEDHVLRSAGGLMSVGGTQKLWEAAVGKVTVGMEDQFARMQDANHLLLVKDHVSLVGATLRRYGYQVGPLLDVLDTMRDKYHNLLLTDSRNAISSVILNDKYEQMMMRKEWEYNKNVLAFRLQTTDATPVFPYIAPFSATVPYTCQIVKSFIQDSVSFLSYGSHIDYYDTVRRYLDKLLITVLNEALLREVRSPNLRVTAHAMQISANMTVLETACEYFAQHAAELCGIPARLVNGLSAQALLRSSQAVAHATMIDLVKSKVDVFMDLTDEIDWNPEEEPRQIPNEYLSEVLFYVQTIAETSQEILPPTAFYKVMGAILEHISRGIVETFVSEKVKGFTVYAVMRFDTDLRELERFADEKYETSVRDSVPGAQGLKLFLLEARQMVNLFLAAQPELFLNPVIRDRNYGVLDPRNVVIVGEKFRDLREKMFAGGRAGGRGSVAPKKKMIDALIKHLKNEAQLT